MNCTCEIPQGRTDGPSAPKLCPTHKRIVLEVIDKCRWWPQSYIDRPDMPEGVKAMMGELLVHFDAGRSRVEEGGPFDSYSQVM
jgi:hypothetical protein